VFAGSIADYKITTVAGSTTVEDLAPSIDGSDGTDTLRSVERLQFADGVLFIPGALSSIELSLLTAAEGSVILGAEMDDRSGISVRSAGDVNGDGFDDVVIGAPGGDAADNAKSDAGESYVIFGTAAGLDASIDLAALTPSQGFVVYGAGAGDYSGVSVSSAGDLNGDGFDDLIIGAPGADTADDAKEGAGESYVIFGTDAGLGVSIDLAALTPSQGSVISGVDAGDNSGVSVSSAGDVNGDGFDDVIISARQPYTAAESYVIFGTDEGFGAGIDLASLTPSQGFAIHGTGDHSGFSVSSAGDVNGDGFDDLILGNEYAGAASTGRTQGGESYVVFGTNAGFGASIDLAALAPSQGFVIHGVAYGGSGFSVSSAGDVNGDGVDDLIIGTAAEVNDDDEVTEEQSFVVFGTAAGFGASLDLASLTPSQGFVIRGEVGEGQFLPMPVSSAGDVNGDGFDDLIVGGPGGYGGGASYVIFGTDAAFGVNLDLAELLPSQGFVIYGASRGDFSGGSVSAAGDVNGDGFDDLIIGASGADSAGDERNLAGESYVIYGGDFTGAVVFAGTTDADFLTGTAGAENFVGGQGDDTLVGSGGADAFQGGEGDDTIAVATLDFFLADGGTRTDTLRLDGAGLALDLTALADNCTRGIEQIDITGSGDNSLTLSVRDVLNISDESNELLVKGDAGDTATIGAGWTQATTGGSNGDGTGTISGQTYQIYTAGQAALVVDTDISTVAA
jgi:hypothetical protein